MTQLNETVMPRFFVEPWPAPSRASPLPLWNAVTCGSGLAREEAGSSNTKTTGIHSGSSYT
ncbi:hypothetical protein FE275_04650 [Pseudomonas koreensis]|nr:hypothetical protein FE275_04650 [Pseudomonas koreensis]